MSIVSAKLGVVQIGANKYRRGIANAVQKDVDDVPESMSVAQKPTFNGTHTKPVCIEREPPKTPYPLYFLQEGSDAPKPLFETYDGPVIPAAPPKTGNTITQLLKLEDSSMPFTPFQYDLGIKPAPRNVKFSNINLASADLFRS